MKLSRNGNPASTAEAKTGVKMVDHEDVRSKRRRSNASQQAHGVVVSLSLHRRHLSDRRRANLENNCNLPGKIAGLQEAGIAGGADTHMPDKEFIDVKEPSFWLPGLMALVPLAAMIVFYGTLVTMIEAFVNSVCLSF